jgi:AmmeMemoRadiSam system protein A
MVMDRYIKLARQTIEFYLMEKKTIEQPQDLLSEMVKNRAGVFVSVHKNNGELRGCIGTILPTRENIAQEIIHNAISAAYHDPRFWPIQKNELKDLEISVDVLSNPEPIDTTEQLNVKKYGVIVKATDGRQGLLLPDIEGIDSVDEQISIACQKGGIDLNDDKIQIYRFCVERHK